VHRIACGLQQVDHKAREAPATRLDGELGHVEIGRRKLLTEQLSADLALAGLLQRRDEPGGLINRQP